MNESQRLKRGTRLVIVIIVVVAVAAVLWFKSRKTALTSHQPSESEEGLAEPATAQTTVLLFADLREENSSCGCADVIRIARSADKKPGVAVQEFDIRSARQEARRHRVRVSPTVVIADQDGRERLRFEGESPDLISRLRSTITALGKDISPVEEDTPIE